MQLLILGCNSIVHRLVPSLIEKDWKLTILSVGLDGYTRVAGYSDLRIVEPNGTLIDDMTYGGIGLADAFWALSEDDNKNTMAAQIAMHIFNVPNVLCLINDHEKVEAFQKLNLQIISATNTVAENILTSIGSTA